MFKRQFRLPAYTQFQKPQTIYASHFILKIAKNNLDYNRYGFVVSKKIDKRAVVRNRLKRRFRACVEQLHQQLSVGYDFLFILKKEAVAQETKDLCQEVKEKLKTFVQYPTSNFML